MRILGVILEANPFHNGHEYFLNEALRTIEPDLCIAVTTTSFSMRGEISLLDKFTKTDVLLNHQIDIVMELPVLLGTHHADIFSKKAVLTLANMGITDLAFGCEIESIDLLDKFINIISSIAFTESFLETKKQRLSQKDSYTKVLSEFLSPAEINLFNQPNVTLAIQYLKTIKDFNLKITPHIIKRSDLGYHNQELTGKLASATAIRNAILLKQDIQSYVPCDVINNIISLEQTNQSYLNILKYCYFVKQPITSILNDKEGINNYILTNGDFTSSLTNLQQSLKNKRYSISRINRLMLFIVLNIDNQQQLLLDDNIKYLRILGLNKKGLSYLSSLPKEIKESLFSSIKEVKNSHSSIYKICELEIEATKLYSIIVNKNELTKLEYRLPIRKD